MSNTKNNTKNDEIKYFSAPHGEDGFLTSLTLVENEGSDYYAIKFKARRGNSNKPRTAAYSVRVNGVQAKEVIGKFADEINTQLQSNKKLWDEKKGDQATSIFIALNVSDTEAKSYSNKHTGEMINYIDGRCTSVAYLAIGDKVLFNKNEKKVEDTAESKDQVIEEGNSSENNSFYINPETGEMLKDVKLDKTDPDFDNKKQALKDAGYSWNNEGVCWSLK
jgi:hypothetical protein